MKWNKNWLASHVVENECTYETVPFQPKPKRSRQLSLGVPKWRNEKSDRFIYLPSRYLDGDSHAVCRFSVRMTYVYIKADIFVRSISIHSEHLKDCKGLKNVSYELVFPKTALIRVFKKFAVVFKSTELDS